LSKPTTPIDSSIAIVRNAAGRRRVRQSRRTKVATQSASTRATIARMAQRPAVWSSSFITQEWAPIHCALAASKNTARAMCSSSGVTAKTVAVTTNSANGTCRWDHQKRKECTVFKTTASFR
jgi:hypothetical protein